ncbi:MAG: hypothetical protein ABJN85_09260 [Gilvibacter sp.]
MTRIQNYVPVVMLLVFVSVEFFSKYTQYQGHQTDVQKIVKAIFLVFFAAAILYDLKSNSVRIKQLILLFVLFCVGQYFVTPMFSNYNLTTFSRYLFPIFLFTYLIGFRPNAVGRKRLFLAFEWFLVINFALLLVGLFFEPYVLKTYTGDRFGYNGVLLTSSTSTYVYFAALGYFYFAYRGEVFKKWRFWIVLVSCFIVGTKSLYLGVVLFTIVVVLGSSFKYKKALFVIGGILSIVALYFILYQVPQFAQIRENDGILSALLSYRDQLFIDQTLPYVQENWGVANYLFGGVSDFTLRSQMDFIDLFFFWGIIGGIVYLITYTRAFFSFKLEPVHWVFFISLGLIVFTAGNFFTYTSIPLYLAILREAIISHQDSHI